MTNPQGARPIERPSQTEEQGLVALPTEFDNYTFRSRTEARWAVFFKILDMPYEYEPQGFELSNGMWYNPDFYLPSIRCWGEVKPTFLEPDEEIKCRLLSAGTGFPCLFLIGPPDFRSYRGATWDCGEYTVVQYSLDIDAYWKAYEKEHRLYSEPNYRVPPDETQFSEPYRHAILSSRSYKFEGLR